MDLCFTTYLHRIKLGNFFFLVKVCFSARAVSHQGLCDCCFCHNSHFQHVIGDTSNQKEETFKENVHFLNEPPFPAHHRSPLAAALCCMPLEAVFCFR